MEYDVNKRTVRNRIGLNVTRHDSKKSTGAPFQAISLEIVQENGIGRGTVPLLGLEPRVFRLEGGRAIRLRHRGGILHTGLEPVTFGS